MGCIRLRRWQFWSAGASEARPRFGSLGATFLYRQSAVAAALCRRTPKAPRVAYPADSSVSVSRSAAEGADDKSSAPSLQSVLRKSLKETTALTQLINEVRKPVRVRCGFMRLNETDARRPG